jgi:hypothetical protein
MFSLTLPLSVVGALLALGLFKVIRFLYVQFDSPLRDLPGPSSNNFFYGDLKQIWESVSRQSPYGLKYSFGLTVLRPSVFRMARRCKKNGSSSTAPPFDTEDSSTHVVLSLCTMKEF